MPDREKLEELAIRVERMTNFNQIHHWTCVIGEARQMYQEKTGNKPVGIMQQDTDIAKYFGLTVDEVDAIYCAEYSRLNIGMDDFSAISLTQSIAANMLRQLAVRG